MMVNKAMPAGAGAAIGDSPSFEMAPDTAPRTVAVPADFKRALARNAAARKFYEGLSPSHKKASVQWLAEAKQAETRTRRPARSVEMLAAGKTRW